ncbi:MAG: hypothetical protein P8M53_12405 [Pirellulales bacterium]|nr:hypothetical protein [Pirellulales bacterium]
MQQHIENQNLLRGDPFYLACTVVSIRTVFIDADQETFRGSEN